MKSYSTKYFLVCIGNGTDTSFTSFMQVGPFWTDESLEAAKNWIKMKHPYTNIEMSEPWEYPVWDHIGDN